MAYTNVEQVFKEGLPKRFRAIESQHDRTNFQFHVGDEDWHLLVEDGVLTITQEKYDNPHATLTIKPQDFLDMADGKESIQLLYMQGKLKVEGDLTYAVKLARYFPAEKK